FRELRLLERVDRATRIANVDIEDILVDPDAPHLLATDGRGFHDEIPGWVRSSGLDQCFAQIGRAPQRADARQLGPERVAPASHDVAARAAVGLVDRRAALRAAWQGTFACASERAH